MRICPVTLCSTPLFFETVAYEIERKFLLREGAAFKEESTHVLHIIQAYICREKGRTVRIRVADEKGYLTIKGPASNGISRMEWEREITFADAKDLLSVCLPPIIEKERYIIPIPDGRKWEVDVFHADNEGLVMAEIELSSPDQPYPHPAWLGKEVTGDPKYYNSNLGRHPFREWSEEEKNEERAFEKG